MQKTINLLETSREDIMQECNFETTWVKLASVFERLTKLTLKLKAENTDENW